jgi:hypothetical protein
MDEVIRATEGDIPGCMLFADDVVLVGRGSIGSWSFRGKPWNRKLLDLVELRPSTHGAVLVLLKEHMEPPCVVLVTDDNPY